ncbi:MAG: hypothetical protein LKJ76_06300 [Lachnospiraceae bacterium]|nr:hypothetical protein [Lachnospiraceae bacterium]
MKTVNNNGSENKKYPWTLKRVLACVCIAALVAMYLVAFVLACLSSPASAGLFRASLALTVILPVFCWIFIWGYGFLNHRKTIASIQILNSDETARREMEDAARRAVQETGSAADNAAENSPENPAKP